MNSIILTTISSNNLGVSPNLVTKVRRILRIWDEKNGQGDYEMVG